MLLLRVYLKKLWIRFFTDLPYKIRRFKSAYPLESLNPVDFPESLTGILIQEKGDLISYPGLPQTFGQEIVLRRLNKKDRFKYSGVFTEAERIMYSIDGGYIFGQIGIIYDKQLRTYIEESAREWITPLRFSRFTNIVSIPPVKELKGVVLSCLTNGADAGFYHFFFESLPKLFFSNRLSENIDYYILNGPASEWKIKWLKKAKIDLNKVVWMPYNGHFRCKQLLFTNNLINDQQISRWCVDSLKSLLNVSQNISSRNEYKKVLWITRTNVNTRIIKWEDSILAFFPFIDKVDFSDLNENETIKKISNATYIIGPHGAGFSNLIFCNPGTCILELFPLDTYYIPCYFRLSTVCDLKHKIAYIDFENENSSEAGLSFLKEALSAFLPNDMGLVEKKIKI